MPAVMIYTIHYRMTRRSKACIVPAVFYCLSDMKRWMPPLFAIVLFEDFRDGFLDRLDLLVEFRGGDALRAVAEDNELLQTVGGRHAHPPALSERIGHAFDILVGGLGLLGVDDVDVVIFSTVPRPCGTR